MKKKFDWKKFHKDLDNAMATMIMEKDDFLPSKARFWDFLLFVNEKIKAT